MKHIAITCLFLGCVLQLPSATLGFSHQGPRLVSQLGASLKRTRYSRLHSAPILPDDKLPTEETEISFRSAANDSLSFREGAKITSIEAQKEEKALAVILLNIVAIIWGTQHAVIKLVVDDSSAAPFTLLRFILAALIALPYTPGLQSALVGKDESLEKTQAVPDQTAKAWRWGAEMGAWMFMGFAFQAIGLETTTAQRSGFLLYLNVKFVPFFSLVLLGKDISLPTWVSALAAFVGTALLATDGQSMGFNIGDIWSIAAAAASAMYIIRLEKATASVQDAAQLNSACLWVVASLAAFWTFSGGFSGQPNLGATLDQLQTIATSHPFEILYLGAITTTLANYIQSKGQQYVSPERASIFYSLDPVYGAFFSWFLLGEQLGGVQSLVGAGMMTVAAATNAFLDFGKDESMSKDLAIQSEKL